MKKKIGIFIAIIIFTSFFFWNFHHQLYSPFNSQEKQIYLSPGMKTIEIFELLKGEKLIPSKWPLILDILIYPKHLSLKHGEYRFEKGMSPFQIIDKIFKGDVVMYKITIPEGLTSYEITQKIKKINELEGTLSKVPEEGSLFPSTYEYKRGQTRASLTEKMEKEMTKLKSQLMLKYKQVNFQEKLIMASLIEKETRVDHERPRIAGVFYHRLSKKMKLQCDPTVIYAVTNGQGVLNRPISKIDLKTDSPFNTYRFEGLPPGPICNPGKASLIAAFEPIETQDLYFVVKGGGEHEFSKTLANHNKAVANLRKLEKEKK